MKRERRHLRLRLSDGGPRGGDAVGGTPARPWRQEESLNLKVVGTSSSEGDS